MQLFYLDHEKVYRAAYICDQHLGKAIFELTQLLCNAHHVWQEREEYLGSLYKPTHINHPLSRWTMANVNNYRFVLNEATFYAAEYYYRFSKCHNSEEILCGLRTPRNIRSASAIQKRKDKLPPNLTNRKDLEIVSAYRLYYAQKLHEWATRKNKRQIKATWTSRKRPFWISKALF